MKTIYNVQGLLVSCTDVAVLKLSLLEAICCCSSSLEDAKTLFSSCRVTQLKQIDDVDRVSQGQVEAPVDDLAHRREDFDHYFPTDQFVQDKLQVFH